MNCELFVQCRCEYSQTASRTNDLHSSSTRHPWGSLPEDKVSRYLHEGGSGAEDQPPGVSCSGIPQLYTIIHSL